MSGIYVFTNTANGKKYVGQSVNVAQRKSAHLSLLRNKRHHNEHLQAAFDYYGADVFEFTVLELVPVDMLDVRERSWIAYYRSTDSERGYNNEVGGCTGHALSPEHKRKISCANKGRKRTEEERAKMSAAQRLYLHVISPNQRAAMVAGLQKRAALGIIVSPETKAKISAAAKKRGPPSAATRAKMSTVHRMRWAANPQSAVTRARRAVSAKLNWAQRRAHYGPTGKSVSVAPVVSAATRAKIGAASKGRVVSAETRAKLSAAGKARYAAAGGALVGSLRKPQA